MEEALSASAQELSVFCIVLYFCLIQQVGCRPAGSKAGRPVQSLVLQSLDSNQGASHCQEKPCSLRAWLSPICDLSNLYTNLTGEINVLSFTCYPEVAFS